MEVAGAPEGVALPACHDSTLEPGRRAEVEVDVTGADLGMANDAPGGGLVVGSPR
jgi:hypothetical protein